MNATVPSKICEYFLELIPPAERICNKKVFRIKASCKMLLYVDHVYYCTVTVKF